MGDWLVECRDVSIFPSSGVFPDEGFVWRKWGVEEQAVGSEMDIADHHDPPTRSARLQGGTGDSLEHDARSMRQYSLFFHLAIWPNDRTGDFSKLVHDSCQLLLVRQVQVDTLTRLKMTRT